MTASVWRLRPPVWVQDLLLAAFVVAFQVRGTVLVAAPQADVRPLAVFGGLGWALLVASGAVLVLRRRHPVGVFAVEVVISATYYVLHLPDGPGWTSLFVALYTVTATATTRRTLPVAAATMAGLTVVWLLTARLWPLNDAGWVFFRLGAAVMAAALGESVRARRELHAEALARAERAEHDRDRQARQKVDTERLRIARDVHDTVAHAIALINIQASAARHVLDRRPDRAREALGVIEQTSAKALDELRATLTVLRNPEPVRPAPGAEPFDDVARTARVAGLDIDLTVTGPLATVPAPVLAAAHRISQEAVTNVVRHATATRVSIHIHTDDRQLQVVVRDDGRPAARAEPDRTSGHGIAGMRERCTLLGGELTAGTHPGGGFEVRAVLPLAAPAVPLP